MEELLSDAPSRRPPVAQRGPRVSSPRDPEPCAQAWAGCRTLYGGFYALGVSIRAHSFLPSTETDWARSFYPESLEVCLNLAGRGRVRDGQAVLEFGAGTAGFYRIGRRWPQASRQAGEQQEFLTIEFSAAYLRRQLAACDGALHPAVERFMHGVERSSGLGEVRPITADWERLAAQLSRPPVAQAARALWYHSKVLQLIVDFFFARPGADELFCDRQKRVARERADAVIALLRQHLAEPLRLEAIARKVGCSPFYLSRTFSQETGMTIPQYLRKIRMERAAELLRGGGHNVTEAAVEVGYSSLSHFSQAFCQTMGCCPALYPVRERSHFRAAQSAVKE